MNPSLYSNIPSVSEVYWPNYRGSCDEWVRLTTPDLYPIPQISIQFARFIPNLHQDHHSTEQTHCPSKSSDLDHVNHLDSCSGSGPGFHSDLGFGPTSFRASARFRSYYHGINENEGLASFKLIIVICTSDSEIVVVTAECLDAENSAITLRCHYDSMLGIFSIVCICLVDFT
jgi:hypothetical protein